MKLLTKQLIDLVNQDLTKDQLIAEITKMQSLEIEHISQAFRTGWITQDKWSLDLEIYDHILMRYNEEAMTYDEFHALKKSVDFWKKIEGGHNG
jgi:hypothetical protein